MRIKRVIKRKKAMESEMIGWWIIALAVLGIMLVGYFIIKGKGIGAIEYFKNIRFGR